MKLKDSTEHVEESKKESTWFDKYGSKILMVVLVVVGLGMVFNQPIRNALIAKKSNEYQVENVSKKEIEENKKADTTFDFAQVEPISTESVMRAQMDSQKLPAIGGIAIPDLGVNLPIFKGLGNTELSFGAGTMKETQVMGGENNYSLASHHVFGITGASNTLFSPLERGKAGMPIYLTDKDKIYTYTITEVFDVDPTAVHVIDDTPGKSELTLVTCTDAAATGRTIVKAELTKTEDYKTASKDIRKAFSTEYNQVAEWK